MSLVPPSNLRQELTLSGFTGYDPIRWVRLMQHPLGLHDPRIRF